MRPLLIYDGDCAFCRRWVERWRARTGAGVLYRAFRRRGWRGRWRVRRRDARRAVQLLDEDGRRSSGAEAVFRLLAHAPGRRARALARVGRSPPVLWLAERIYRLVAGHRAAAARVDRLLFGRSTAPPTRRLVRWLFLRALGAVYLIAFTSLRAQVLGLYGSRGIAPIGRRLARLRARRGRGAYRLAPSLLWLGSTDRDLVRLCGAGQACGGALMLGLAPRLTTAAAWALYLSFVTVGGEFLSFQWDALLLEAGLSTALLAARAPSGEPSWGSAALLRWLLFRLHVQSGLVKLQSGDPSWRRCTACAYHYQTQPLPTRLGWYAHHLPRPIQIASTAAALGVELGAPFLVFAPRRLRRLGFGAMAGLQALIAATGNYAFFNLLTGVLSLWALDDDSLRWLRRAVRPARAARPRPAWLRRLAGIVHGTLVAAVAAVSALTFSRGGGAGRLARAASRLDRAIAPLRSINPYGLFAVMTTRRPEIAIEGSADGRVWREYAFRYKPSRLEDAPRWVAPHQPRLDWQLWFAALGAPPPWFASLLRRLLEGSPEVLRLFRGDPFPDRPPRYVRALLYEYRMTDLPTKRRTGRWWERALLGPYFPTCTLAEVPKDP
ncbi:MAG TPA: lipase maturation factor family protein [Polyangia bacterium]|nr:lipase maturation factor family protein [Polyangia bacterium]